MNIKMNRNMTRARAVLRVAKRQSSYFVDIYVS